MKTKRFAPGTPNLKNVFAILILAFGLNSEAFPQYEKLLKGQPTTFDTAVAVRIDRYRQEGNKLKLGEQLVDSLGKEIRGLRVETALHRAQEKNFINTTFMLVKANNRKDSVNTLLKENFRQFSALATKQSKDSKLLK